MTRPRIRAALLAIGAGLATGYASVSDFTGVIHSYYTGTGAAGLPAAGRKDALGHRAVAPPQRAPGKPGRPPMTRLFPRCGRRGAAGPWPYRSGVRPPRVAAGKGRWWR